MPKTISSKFTRPTTGPFELKKRLCKECSELIPFGGPCPKPACLVKVYKAAEKWADGVVKENVKENVKATPEQLTQCMPSLAPQTMPTALTALAMVSRVMNAEVTKVAKQHLAEERFKLSYEEDFSFKGLLCKVMMFRNWGKRACRLYRSDNAQPTYAMPVRGEPLTDNMIRAFRVRGYHVMIPDRHSAAAWDDHLMAIISFERGLPVSGSFTTYDPLGPLEPMQPSTFEHLDFGGLRRDSDDEEDDEEGEDDEEDA
jgi:hypothetical protein